MKTKASKILAIFLVIITAFSSVLPAYAGQDSRSKEYYNNIISYNTGSNSIQSWIDTTLSKNAGSGCEWYILSLVQNEKANGNRYNYANFERALIDYTKRVKNINPSSKLRIALILASIGSTNSFINDTMNTAIGKQGIMSYIFGLHMLNNGYKSNNNSKSSVTNTLTGMQQGDGSWALIGNRSDIDVTAMAIQALAPQYHNSSSVKSAIDKALNYLSYNQQANATFTALNGGNTVETCESTTQVILALASLKIDCVNDSRFIKNGNTLFDALSLFKSDKGFCHVQNGGVNNLANQQVLYTMVGYNRMNNLFILDKARPNEVETNSANNSSNGGGNSNGQSNSGGSSNSGNHNSNGDSYIGGYNGVSIGNSQSSNDSVANQNAITDDSQKSNADTTLQAEENETDTSPEEELSVVNGESDIQKHQDEISNISNKIKKSNYKIWSILAICVVAIIGCAVLYFTKKGNKGNYLIVIGVSVVAIIIVLVTNFQSVDAHNNAVIEKSNTIGTVTISINCDSISDKTDNEFIPDDGIILDATSIEIAKNDTVYTVLSKVCTKYDIALETTGSTNSIYVEGINHIYELQYGDLSGWMYHVNSDEPSISCGSYTLSDGDVIEWKYTCDLGQDIKE